MLVLTKTDPYKLTINRTKDILDNGPIIPRCYEVAYLKPSKSMSININKDENKSKNIYSGESLCGRWCNENERYMLFFQVNVDTRKMDYDKAKGKDKLIRQELPLMLNSIIKSEENFLKANKDLNEAEIFIKFNSQYDDFYKVENWGCLRNYIGIETYDEKKLKEREFNNQQNRMRNKIDMNEKLILNLINPHIETHLFPMYGRDIRLLIKDVKILDMEEIDGANRSGKEYEVVVSVKILNRNTVEELLLNIRVKPNVIIIKKIE